ncbi:hypothetical protein L1285_19190 [Pseudoalteromonas sp. DL2-H2.2]|uniref:hypothetical protein n=1 Tax=Pseudoalteromonas sp. DL2-H2.2 TaxID=2908889 RepID=UPI001F2E2DC8|nr:hypothetical protein [Pseudoalteromonas sp. DL2-H2.2]MCF2910441.1 hypothetical protein [Pseudoalteromonas sp. DL2-H2.2]
MAEQERVVQSSVRGDKPYHTQMKPGWQYAMRYMSALRNLWSPFLLALFYLHLGADGYS